MLQPKYSTFQPNNLTSSGTEVIDCLVPLDHGFLHNPTSSGTPETGDPDDTQLAWQYDEESDRLYVNYPEDWGVVVIMGKHAG